MNATKYYKGRRRYSSSFSSVMFRAFSSCNLDILIIWELGRLKPIKYLQIHFLSILKSKKCRPIRTVILLIYEDDFKNKVITLKSPMSMEHRNCALTHFIKQVI